MPNAMQVINAGLYADRVVESILKFQAKDVDAQENRHSCRKALKADGFEVLGSGYYGFVVAGPADSDFVVKVCIDGNDGYPMYAKWAKANPQPGVMPVWLAERITETCFVAVLPRLLPVDGCDERQKEAQTAIRAARYNEKEINPKFEYLRQTVRNVLDTLGDFAGEDMHYGNWMQCPETGMVYLTDPFSGLYCDREKAESTAARGVYVPPLKDQFDLFEPTYEQRRAIEEAKTAGTGAAAPNPFSTDFAACGLKSAKKSFPMPPPWAELNRPCLARNGAGDDCNCAGCRLKRADVKVIKPRLVGNDLQFRVPPDLKPGKHDVKIQGMMADIVAFDDKIARDMGAFQQIARDNAAFFRQPVGHIQGRARDQLRNQWFLEGVECNSVQFRAWDIAKPLMRKNQKPDAWLLRILGDAAERFGLHNLFGQLPVREVRYHDGIVANVMRMNTQQLAQPVNIKQRLELDFNELERRVVAHAGGHQPNGRFDVRLFTRCNLRPIV